MARLGERDFDVLVTDLEMPRLNGYELLEDVRRRAGTRRSARSSFSRRDPARSINTSRAGSA